MEINEHLCEAGWTSTDMPTICQQLIREFVFEHNQPRIEELFAFRHAGARQAQSNRPAKTCVQSGRVIGHQLEMAYLTGQAV